jgi:hypothetical protein
MLEYTPSPPLESEGKYRPLSFGVTKSEKREEEKTEQCERKRKLKGKFK